MRIAIEAQRIFRKKKHGMDIVILETLRELQRTDHSNQYFILVKPGKDPCLKSTDNFQIIEIYCPSYLVWEQIALPLVLRKLKPDILHCTSNTAPVFCHYPLVLTLHDIIFLEKRTGKTQSIYQKLGRLYRKLVIPRIIRFCKRIITVSNYEQKRITEKLELTNDMVVAVHNGLSPLFRLIPNDRHITSQYIPFDQYLFFLGNTDPKKNTVRTLKAYALYLKQSRRSLPLLIADLEKTTVDKLLDKEGLENIKHKIYCPGYISHQDLPHIYGGAFAFLYPSMRESFGLPILEAMACGTPVITSNTSAIPEIAGEKAMLIDPENEQEIADQIIKLEENQPFYQQQIEYGIKRSKLFSWEETAKNLLNIYLNLNHVKEEDMRL